MVKLYKSYLQNQEIIQEMNERKDTITITRFVPSDLRGGYQICRILDDYLPAYFDSQEQVSDEQISDQIYLILAKFKKEVIDSLAKKKDDFIKNVTSKNKGFINIFEFSKSENLYLSSIYTRFISENLGHRLEEIANISHKVFSPEESLRKKIKGIDIIVYDDKVVKYTQIKTKKDTLTGSHKSRTIDELSIHPHSLFVAALNMGGSLTIGDKDKYGDGIKRLVGDEFWSLIGLDYNFILDRLSQVIRELDKELYE